ncbi:ABC transporter permease [Mobilicoccus caccae]|uniref:Transport permease protein n=1 Tax=Mobilicoccus caccae TaxID=1859295 RepID=A0ABQ6IM58_9MICO|nr:ABC transporter permease [Mobilicoccus caccae]GMA39005.1 ABC transporter [Mobilicoccus caccae]
MSIARHTGIVFSREVKPLLRSPFQMVISVLQPMMFLALFAPLLPGGATPETLQWFVPGMVAMSCLTAATMTGSNLMYEMQTGSHERLLVSPLSRSSLLLGRALKEVVPVVAQVLVLVLVTWPFGFAVHPLGIAVAVVLLGLFSVGVGALSFALALVSKHSDWMFWTVQQTLLFPVLLSAGVLLPLDNAPAWLRLLSQVNPLAHVVEATRELFAGRFPVDAVGAGFLATGILVAVGLAVGIRAMQKAD